MFALLRNNTGRLIIVYVEGIDVLMLNLNTSFNADMTIFRGCKGLLLSS